MKGRSNGKKGHRKTNSTAESFKTDADISHGQYKERELQKWVPDEKDLNNPLLTLSSNNENWDQFKVNEDKFGVESTYDEHLYTTRINTSAPDYLQRVKKAERIASEIENSATKDSHILEERGFTVDDSGIDEEDKYSGVDRRGDDQKRGNSPAVDGKDRRGDDIMAALRNVSLDKNEKANNNNYSSNASQGKYTTPRQRAADYHNDPAIISSSATKKKPASPAPPQQSQPPKKTDAKSSTISSKQESNTPKSQAPTNQHQESFRLNAQSEINSLREFSANFKIPHKIPTDLLPILSRDKMKQEEILKKQGDEVPAKPKKKFDASKPAFKLNPKAAAFTPGQFVPKPPSFSQPPYQASPSPKANYRSPINPSPQMMNSRPYSSMSNSSSGGAVGGNVPIKRHQISASDFFGGANKVPTKEGQIEKIKKFNKSFNHFTTTKNKWEGDKSKIIYEKAFQTPPTWTSNFDESYEKLFENVGPPSVASPSFIGSPVNNIQMGPMGYPGPNANFALSPQQQAAAMAAHYQQQQFHAAMMYQQQQHQHQHLQPQFLPGQPPMPMFGAEPPFLPPGGFIPPPGGFPVNGGFNYNQQNRRYNNNHHNPNPSKRGGHN